MISFTAGGHQVHGHNAGGELASQRQPLLTESVLELQAGHGRRSLGVSARETAAMAQVEQDLPLHTCSQLGELELHVPLPVGIEQWVQEGVAQPQQPEEVLNDFVGEALRAGHLHDAGDEEGQPGEGEAPDEHGHRAHGLHVTGGTGWGTAATQPCLLHLLDMLHVHRGDFQHVTVEVEEEEECREEAEAEHGEHVGRLEEVEEGAFPMVGDPLEVRDEDRQEANDGSKEPEPHQAQPNSRACHQLEIVERLPDGQVPVTCNQDQGQDGGSTGRGHKSHSKDAKLLGSMKGLGKLIHSQAHDCNANHGICQGKIEDETEPLGAALPDVAEQDNGHQHVGSDDE